ncbi:hypothetical protein PF005_g17010 [Phytophthora fragariae]|uniref:Uncharacterized protein n=1 Tax=Phytophthora fragariae TaxID=53985 RepID=A0A6A3Y4Y4_9STRA|nr:hypothetical protein PF003_g21207 [Phytophthora fragariae]KAE8931697.1 hypothetical protein PF009_g18248 [Phytophthora fragariae]KAE8996304.1 hypothetical protein PF011_g15957 [Phytophthora fragariae]KAE9055830.1 hypothetical protein PF006_g32849 [Phytophthora fragariae]KAE9096020.1 hypothetical protein PF007_g17163 [Phytophthora fragariae]
MGKKTKPRTSMLMLMLGGMVYQGRVCLDARIPVGRRHSHTSGASDLTNSAPGADIGDNSATRRHAS